MIETERLVLRRFRATDLADWLEHMNTPEGRTHLGGVEAPEAAASRFERQRSSWSESGGGWLAVVRRADGAFLGHCGFGAHISAHAPAEMRGCHEIGWGLRTDCWGHGYATEAAAAVLGLVFGRFGLERIYSQTSEANRASWRVMERLGLERMAHLDYDDPDYPPEENPTKVYRQTREAWQAAHG